MSSEAEINVERKSTIENSASDSRADGLRETIFAGYRWDFR